MIPLESSHTCTYFEVAQVMLWAGEREKETESPRERETKFTKLVPLLWDIVVCSFLLLIRCMQIVVLKINPKLTGNI